MRRDIPEDRHPLSIRYELLKHFPGNSGPQMKKLLAEPRYRDNNQFRLTG
jgi:hypothetical protein